MPEWQIPTTTASQIGYSLTTAFPQHFADGYAVPYQTSPTDFIPNQSELDTSLSMENSYFSVLNPSNTTPWDSQAQAMHTDFMDFPINTAAMADMNLQQQNFTENSPTDTFSDIRSLTSSMSDNGWKSVDRRQPSLDSSFYDGQTGGALFNPGQIHHETTFSDSSYSDIEFPSQPSWNSYVDVRNLDQLSSPGSESLADRDYHHVYQYPHDQAQDQEDERDLSSSPVMITSSTVQPIDIKVPAPPQPSPTSTGRSSPPGKRQSRKNTNPKATKPTIRRPSQAPKLDTEKKVGRRKGPLRPEQRKQACEIRKLGACLRCRFLKKTCDKGEPCGGCQPSHARLWQVPCTRIDIKEIAYFMKDWRADYDRHVTLGASVGNIKGFADTERTLFITHGYGHYLPVRAREVFVRDERCFGLDWVETMNSLPEEYSVNTEKLSAGMEGVSTHLLSDYLDRHIDGGFPGFVDEYFEGTPFLTEMLKTAYRFWLREKTPVIRKSLKLLLAYNLTQHVTMVQGIPDEEDFLGKITDETSKFFGKTVAPVMINFQIKCAMADMWRELQKDILIELSRLYSSVYTKDKLKHWPTIFMVASILLGVWEEMQFDSHYRIPDKAAVAKFCSEMESTPVGVIVGLFSAISQKLPALTEWDSQKHHSLLNSNPAICEALTEVRDHVIRHDAYLRTRSTATFDRDDFDCLSSKFVSKLVIRAN